MDGQIRKVSERIDNEAIEQLEREGVASIDNLEDNATYQWIIAREIDPEELEAACSIELTAVVQTAILFGIAPGPAINKAFGIQMFQIGFELARERYGGLPDD